MNALRRIGKYCAFFAIAALLAGCSSDDALVPKPVKKSLVVAAGPNINLDQDQKVANPVVIRLYQLSSRTEFKAAAFWDIFNDNEALSGVVIDKVSLPPLYPDEKRKVEIDLAHDTYFLGAFAEFAHYENQTFADAVPVSADALDEGVTVNVTASGVAIEYPEDDGFFSIFTDLF